MGWNAKRGVERMRSGGERQVEREYVKEIRNKKGGVR
jgi:hypothetical protein